MERSAGRNTLWKYFGLSTRATLPQGNEGKDDKIELLTLQIEGLIQKMNEDKTIESIKPFPGVLSNTNIPTELIDYGNKLGVSIRSVSIEGDGTILISESLQKS
jgi:hypothetical protein